VFFKAQLLQVKRIIFLGICFFLTFTAVQVAVNLLNKSVATEDHFFVDKNSNKDSSFVVNGILEWEDSIQEARTQSKFCCVLPYTRFVSLFSTTYTTEHRTATLSNWSYVLQKLFVLFENFRL
jgi:hypothetical protein